MSAIADLYEGLARLSKARAELDPTETVTVTNNFDLLLKIAELDNDVDVALWLKDQIRKIEGIQK
jgi:hypothetical protein